MAKKKDQDRLENLAKLLAEALSEDAKTSEEFFQSHGIDIERSYRKNSEFMESLQRKEELREAHVRRTADEGLIQELLEKARARLGSVKDPVKTLTELFADNERLAIQFRKLDDITAEDALEILGESELLKLLDSLKDEEETDR